MNNARKNGDAGMSRAKVEAWAASYKQCWETLDTELFLTLFDEDAVYQATPFSMPFRGPNLRIGWDAMKEQQSQNRIDLEVWCVEGDLAILHWSGQSMFADKGKLDGDGLFFLRFNGSGRCINLREWQHWIPAGSPPTKGFIDNP
jgi:hypothetical protein